MTLNPESLVGLEFREMNNLKRPQKLSAGSLSAWPKGNVWDRIRVSQLLDKSTKLIIHKYFNQYLKYKQLKTWKERIS